MTVTQQVIANTARMLGYRIIFYPAGAYDNSMRDMWSIISPDGTLLEYMTVEPKLYHVCIVKDLHKRGILLQGIWH